MHHAVSNGKIEGLHNNRSDKREPGPADFIVVLGLYVGLALLTQSYFRTITVWPSAGVALAAFLVFGPRIWPAVALGTLSGVFAWFIVSGQPPLAASNLVICLLTVAGNTGASLVALRLCGRVDSKGEAFARFDWVSRFLSATIAFGAVSAIPSVGAYWLVGRPWADGFMASWLGWTISNAVGAIALSPLLVNLWLRGSSGRSAPGRQAFRPGPHLAAFLSLAVLVVLMFMPSETPLVAILRQPSFLMVPLVFVALMRGQTVIFAMLAFSLFAVWTGTTMGYGPFAGLDEAMAHASMQAFVGMSSAVILIMQAILVERRVLQERWADDIQRINLKLEDKVAERTMELSESNRKLEALSSTDGLTGIANRRSFDDQLAAEYARHARSGTVMSLILLDIDYFKLYNDNYGHIEGDDCLKRVALAIAGGAARPSDLVARYGGEEFACILPETDAAGAYVIAERIRQAVQALGIQHKASIAADSVTVSLGVLTVDCRSGGSTQEMLVGVDRMLYKAKSLGRNRVEALDLSEAAVPASGLPAGDIVRLVWQDSFGSGNKLIDAQHQGLFRDSNELFDAVLHGRREVEISAVIARLLDDVVIHFRDEEEILASIVYPDLAGHGAEHAALVDKALDMSRRFADSTISIGDVFQFLVNDVVMLHMLGADRKFFPFIAQAADAAGQGADHGE